MSIRNDWANWKSDRLENEEALMIDEFYKFMRSLGHTAKELEFTKNKQFRAREVALHRERLRQFRQRRYLF